MTIIEQIEEKTGCSQTTIRRVLRGGNKEIWPGAADRAEHIRKIARELGFLPNASAAAVKNGCFNSILLVLSTDRGRCYLPEALLHSLCAALERAGQHLMIGRFSDDVLTSSDTLPTFLSRWSCDGALVNYTDRFPSHINDLLSQYRIPSIWMNAPFKTDCVNYDERRGGREATRLLIEKGHRRILYVDLRHEVGSSTHYSVEDRLAGYVEAMKEAGRTPEAPVEWGSLSGDLQVKHLVELFRSPKRPTAIVAYDRADRVLLAAAMAGIVVPRDVSIITFGDGFMESAGMAVTRLSLPYEEAGQAAVSLVLKKIAHPDKPLKLDPLPLRLVQGNTCAAPHRNKRKSHETQP